MSPRRSPPRVLHAPIEIAGQAAFSVLGLRAIGVEAHVFAPPHPFAYEPPPDIVPPPGRTGYLLAAARAARAHDVFHFHYGQSFLYRARDARMLRTAGRGVIVEFHGSDVRTPSIERERNPFYVQIEGEDDVVAEQRMRTWAPITEGHAIVGDPALRLFLAPHFEHVHHVPCRIDTHRLTPAPPDGTRTRPLVVHSPSHRAGKGTEHVRRAVEQLPDGEIEYLELHGVSQQEARRIYAQADLIVDQLCTGSYGVFAAESMALAKPVVCYLTDEVAAALPADLPIINANPETIAATLGEWVRRPAADRRERGLRGRAYAERVHDARAVAPRLLEIYEGLP